MSGSQAICLSLVRTTPSDSAVTRTLMPAALSLFADVLHVLLPRVVHRNTLFSTLPSFVSIT